MQGISRYYRQLNKARRLIKVINKAIIKNHAHEYLTEQITQQFWKEYINFHKQNRLSKTLGTQSN